ncbi:MAG: NAD-binding protein [Victivallales bacterium]|nr:NAD-binding protein [Victivallales bacterium]MCF7889364.1 NAD-binding protein [Victivallales bacterium]
MNFSKRFRLRNKIPQFIGAVTMLYGLVHIVIPACVLIGLHIPYVTRFRHTFKLQNYKETGILLAIFFGFLLYIIGKGLWERKRKAWFITVIILSISIINNFLIQTLPQINIVSLTFLILLLIFYKEFNEKSYSNMGYQQTLAWLSIIIALSYGIFGSYLLRSEFENLNCLSDALYYTVVTYSTVGFGDIFPITRQAKFFTVSMILVGLGSFITTFTFLIGPLIENRLKGVLKIMKKLNNMQGHVILCGYTSLSQALIKEFEEKDIQFIVLENSPERKSEIEEKYITVSGSTFQKKTFLNAQIDKAKAVITVYDNDSDNFLTLFTVKELLDERGNGTTQLISRIENEENIEKAEKLGVSKIVSPTKMAASSIINSSFNS